MWCSGLGMAVRVAARPWEKRVDFSGMVTGVWIIPKRHSGRSVHSRKSSAWIYDIFFLYYTISRCLLEQITMHFSSMRVSRSEEAHDIPKGQLVAAAPRKLQAF
jgi:hypothetical protein